MPNSSMKLYSLSEIAQVLGTDEKQLHLFAHKGLIDPKLSNDKTARFKGIDCVRLRIIKQADELGYEPEAIFRLIGKPDEVLDSEDAIGTCEEFAIAKYKQIYDELNHCEPLEQLNKQCDLRLLVGYIKHLKELRSGSLPNLQRQKPESRSKPSPSVKGVKASVGSPGPAPKPPPSASVRRYSVAKYWEYMKKVEELQKEVGADTSADDGATQSSAADPVDDDLELLSFPEESTGEPTSAPFRDDLLEQPDLVSRAARVFDKRQSWGVWALAGAFLVIIAAGYFLFSGHKEIPPKVNPPVAKTDSPQPTSHAQKPAVEQPLSTETVAPKVPEAKSASVTEKQSIPSVPPVDLQVGDLNLWHDSLNNIYRANFTIANNTAESNGEPVSGYAFVYLRFDDGTTDPKSLLLPSGETQAGKPTQIRSGARFSIRHFKQMQVSSVSDLQPSDTMHSDVLVYSPKGELLLEKGFDVSVRPLFSESKQKIVASKESGTAETPEIPPVTPIEPIEPGPPPTAVTEAPQSNKKEPAVASSTPEAEVQPPSGRSETGPNTQTPPVSQPESTSKTSPSVTTRTDTRIEEKTIAAIQPDSGSKPPPSLKTPQPRAESVPPQVPEKVHKPPEPTKPSPKIQSTGNPDAAKWEQKSYNAAVQGDFDAAIADATKAVELDPGRVNPYINRSWAYLEKNMLNKAIQDCQTALSIDPQNAFAYNNRGLVYQRKGKNLLAQKDYGKACDLGLELGCRNLNDLTKQSRVVQLIDKSQAAFNAKDWDGVIRITTEVIELDPQNAVAYTNRSGAYAQKAFLNKALRDSNEAIRINPDFPLAYNNRGYVLELLGNKRKSAADYLKSCSLGLDLGCKNFERLNRAQ